MCVPLCRPHYSTLFGPISPLILKEIGKNLQFLAIFLNSLILRYFRQKQRKTRVFLVFLKKSAIFVQLCAQSTLALACGQAYAHCHTANACASTAMRGLCPHVCGPGTSAMWPPILGEKPI